MKNFVLSAAQRLLPNNTAALLESLPIAATSAPHIDWAYITLPDWAAHVVPEGKPGLYLPVYGEEVEWDLYDWWRGAHDLLTCAAEREFEDLNGPIHSYSFRLSEAMQPIFDHAWVNRIILFLRAWYAHLNSTDETAVFGPIPAPVLHLTHDVDAIKKTLAIRIKQSIFMAFNAFRFAKPALLLKACAFALTPGNFNHIDGIAKLEEQHGRRSIWNFYGGKGGWLRNPKALLLDPGYDVTKINLRELIACGHGVGLHQQFDSWNNAKKMHDQKQRVEKAAGTLIVLCRQHWLRFSFKDTWRAQRAAGFGHDMTLGFNDRIGFRASCALTYTDPSSGMRVTPMVLMDSHLFDYTAHDENTRNIEMDKLLAELKATGGEASIIWHPHTFDEGYGWGDTYIRLLNQLNALGFARV